MGSQVTIFCHSTTTLTFQELAKFIHDGFFFKESPIFVPPVDKEPFVEITTLSIYYDSKKRPIEIAYYRNVNLLGTKSENMAATLIEETLQEIEARSADTNPLDVMEQIRSSSQVFNISFDEWGLTEDGWEMLSGLEAFLAQTLDGVIYATEGVYDKQLKPVLELQS